MEDESNYTMNILDWVMHYAAQHRSRGASEFCAEGLLSDVRQHLPCTAAQIREACQSGGDRLAFCRMRAEEWGENTKLVFIDE